MQSKRESGRNASREAGMSSVTQGQLNRERQSSLIYLQGGSAKVFIEIVSKVKEEVEFINQGRIETREDIR
jgi:hypothetical protein